jgi:hypothetical protein
VILEGLLKPSKLLEYFVLILRWGGSSERGFFLVVKELLLVQLAYPLREKQLFLGCKRAFFLSFGLWSFGCVASSESSFFLVVKELLLVQLAL